MQDSGELAPRNGRGPLRVVSEQPAPAAPEAAPPLVLACTDTDVERSLVRAWAQENHPGARVVDADAPDLARALPEDDGTLVIPVRVTWLPPQHDEAEASRLADLALLRDPRRPWSWMQRRIAGREPERIRISVGDPATTGDLRRRCLAETGTAGELGPFVRLQAEIASDRAERQVIGDRYKVPRLVTEQILASAQFRARLEELAQELGRPPESLLAHARSCLDEVATVQSRLGIDAFRAFMRPMHAKAWSVQADGEAIRSLKQMNKRHALVFLPTHRSYVDPLVLAEVLRDHDMPRNHLIGGDNMAFWPLGPIGKRAGLVFIRRSFGDDAVYKLCVREFLAHLVSKRFNLEWYIEGGRSRTGKLRPPRLGLLHYISAAIEAERAEDVLLVPTSIMYERLTEVRQMTAEQTGATKRSEGLRWMRDYIRAQAVNLGGARVDFGEPLSLRECLEGSGGANPLDKTAFRICDGINRVTPVSVTSLVAFALLGSRDRALTFDEVTRLSGPLLDYVQRRGIPGAISTQMRPMELRRGLDSLVDAGVASCFEGGFEPVWTIAPGGHHVAAFYRNGALHHLVNRAIVELALVHTDRFRDDPDADLREHAWQDALATRDLLKFEFFFATKEEFRDQLRDEAELIAADWEQRLREGGAAALLSLPVSSERAAGGPPRGALLVAHRALRSFIDAQWIVASYLAGLDSASKLDVDSTVKLLLGVGRQHVLQGRVHGEESVSSELFRGALRYAKNQGLINTGTAGAPEVEAGRRQWLAQTEELIGRLREIDALDQELRREVLA